MSREPCLSLGTGAAKASSGERQFDLLRDAHFTRFDATTATGSGPMPHQKGDKRKLETEVCLSPSPSSPVAATTGEVVGVFESVFIVDLLTPLLE